MRIGNKGDTIVEVLLATVVISVVIAGAYALTNRATRINQTALERTNVSNAMREQIELVRGARTAGADTDVWQAISARAINSPPDYSTCASPSSAFFIDPTLNDYYNSSFVQSYGGAINYNGLFRVWIEAFQPSSNSGYIDFHVRSCWEGIGGEHEQNASLVMRIAE